ncbi:MAG: hypothetical protein IT319_15995 [Anaerolineae bacterium]|nr:hypothetical protein [Anaerolineae bacterium]
MNWLKIHRRLLGAVAALALVVVAAGFALTRGYLIHFVLDDTTISREAYFDNAYDTSDSHIPMHCTSGATVGIVYLWEVRCYTTAAALDAYMNPPSSS